MCLSLWDSESSDSSGISLLTTVLPLSKAVDLCLPLWPSRSRKAMDLPQRGNLTLSSKSSQISAEKKKMLRKTRQPLFHPTHNCWYIVASVTWSSALVTDIPVLHLQSRQNETEKIVSNRRETVDFSITRPRIRTLLSRRKEMIERFWKLR